uniref:Uncharacterized protein n=1 Tax=Cannabis sativa TaxID=3483 RepID=A0A803RCP4_CANSA
MLKRIQHSGSDVETRVSLIHLSKFDPVTKNTPAGCCGRRGTKPSGPKWKKIGLLLWGMTFVP